MEPGLIEKSKAAGTLVEMGTLSDYNPRPKVLSPPHYSIPDHIHSFQLDSELL
jgi:hypothetical protein